MLLNTAKLEQAMNLSCAQICAALAESGYSGTEQEILNADFVGMNTKSGQFIYAFSFYNHQDQLDSGRVFITVNEDPATGAVVYTGEY